MSVQSHSSLNTSPIKHILMSAINFDLSLTLLYLLLDKNEIDLSHLLFTKAELEQGSDKPLFYAVLCVLVDMPVFKGGKPDLLSVVP